MRASPKFLCDLSINQLCSADSDVGVNLNFDLVGVAIGVAKISFMIFSGCGGHSSRVTIVMVGVGVISLSVREERCDSRGNRCVLHGDMLKFSRGVLT